MKSGTRYRSEGNSRYPHRQRDVGIRGSGHRLYVFLQDRTDGPLRGRPEFAHPGRDPVGCARTEPCSGAVHADVTVFNGPQSFLQLPCHIIPHGLAIIAELVCQLRVGRDRVDRRTAVKRSHIVGRKTFRRKLHTVEPLDKIRRRLECAHPAEIVKGVAARRMEMNPVAAGPDRFLHQRAEIKIEGGEITDPAPE